MDEKKKKFGVLILAFRGVIFRSLEKIKKDWFPIIILALLFGLCHMAINLMSAISGMIPEGNCTKVTLML
ncbi:CPBP family intramembrane glutamic endopeptidase [Tissierella praeacuta]|uniref:CPBP family intramembrane glutamic endopeptidase n=1 Tax=Tissierella praeacuta TaxID=43131 RepID=UPI001C1099D6|nr:CPBP family intramembrane glutamic endopeptidase [Tissierella praeacuta]MBU5255306.1 CPBP family intramembrane metalloprotease [Tissierella praeacuta]